MPQKWPRARGGGLGSLRRGVAVPRGALEVYFKKKGVGAAQGSGVTQCVSVK